MSDYFEMLEKQNFLNRRDIFAAMAMQGLCSTFTIGRDQPELRIATAESAVKYADALIKSLDRNEPIEKKFGEL